MSDVYSDELERALAGLCAGGLTADAALRVVAMLIAEAPDASRQKIDQLKIMDKLITDLHRHRGNIQGLNFGYN